MPWTPTDLPPAAKNLTAEQADIFVTVANKILSETGDEEQAIRVGMGAVKKFNESKTISEAIIGMVNAFYIIEAVDKIQLPEKVFTDVDTLWVWAKPLKPVAVEKRANGVRAIIVKDSGAKVFVDGTDVSKKMPEVVLAAEGKKATDFIIDSIVELYNTNGLAQGTKATQESLVSDAATQGVYRAMAIDLLEINGEDLREKPYSERREALKKGIKQGEWIVIVKSQDANDKPALEKLTRTLLRDPNNQAVLIKQLSAPRDVGWAKLESALEINAKIIGMRKEPLPKPDKRKMSSEEMNNLLPALLESSDGYVYRVSVLLDDKEVPAESGEKLTDDDLTMTWHEQNQEWTGFEDPRLWAMTRSWPTRTAGEIGYGNVGPETITPAPKLGDILQIAVSGIHKTKGGVQLFEPRVISVREKPAVMTDVKPLVNDTGEGATVVTEATILKAERFYKYALVECPENLKDDSPNLEKAFVLAEKRIYIDPKGIRRKMKAGTRIAKVYLGERFNEILQTNFIRVENGNFIVG